MTSYCTNAPGPDQTAPGPGGRAGFTLVEILLVIALLGLGAMLTINGAADLLRTRAPRPDEIFWQSVTSARQLALERNQPVLFRYDKEKHTLGWGLTADSLHTVPFPGPQLEFLPVNEQGTILIGGQLTETGALGRVRFYGDGGCDAFRVQLTDSAGHRTVLAIDPWTCAPILAATP